MLKQTVEVYEIAENLGELTDPYHIITTGCRGLTAIETSKDVIYMGFMGKLADINCINCIV